MHKVFDDFVKFAARELGITKLPKVVYTGHEQDRKLSFGDTTREGVIHVRYVNRHPMDVMRTIAHELYHYKLSNNSSSQPEEDKANIIAGRIMKKYNSKYPQMFKSIPMREEVVSALPPNNAGAGAIEGIGVGPKGEPGMMPGRGKLRLFKNAMLSRKKPELRGLRDILNKEVKNEKRQETRTS